MIEIWSKWGKEREREWERYREKKEIWYTEREICSKRGKEKGREFFLWKLQYSVRDSKYGILLEIRGNTKIWHKLMTEKHDLHENAWVIEIRCI